VKDNVFSKLCENKMNLSLTICLSFQTFLETRRIYIYNFLYINIYVTLVHLKIQSMSHKNKRLKFDLIAKKHLYSKLSNLIWTSH